MLPRLWARLTSSRRRLKLSDIEQVETHAVRAAKRGGNVFYRYRTVLRGRGLTVAIASGDGYRQMVRSILPRLDADALDVRSLELRDHLEDAKETLTRAEFARIPASDVLRDAMRSRPRNRRPHVAGSLAEEEKADDLQSLANSLRLSGYLLRALEAFRRALVLKPMDGRLLLEFARCLHSFAAVERDPRLERKAIAALRLSEKRAGDDEELLARLAETYYQVGEWGRSAALFQRVADTVGSNFRALKGLGELALQDGKLAHVIHHFSAASRIASTPSLRRSMSGEADYFSRLNNDEEYMEMEVSRVGLLETLETLRRTAVRILLVSFPMVVVGVMFEDDLVANLGWAICTIDMVVWAGLTIGSRMFSRRIPYHLLEDED